LKTVAMCSVGKHFCLVIGTPRGFTRSVLEAILKRGSKVLFTCSDESAGLTEHQRLSGLYGARQIFYTPADQTCPTALESVFLSALDNFGEINYVVNSTANDPLQLRLQDLQGEIRKLEEKLDFSLVQQDVLGMRRIGQLATKYMSKQNGLKGGTLLNLTSSVELSGHGVTGDCSVLGTTRCLGLASRVRLHGVKTLSVYQPTIAYPDLTQATHITDDQHSPYSEWNKYSSYIGEYTGYMALHLGDTAPPGTAWAFNKELRLREVSPEDLSGGCGIANKMCYWLGCPMIGEENIKNEVFTQEERMQEVEEAIITQEEAVDS